MKMKKFRPGAMLKTAGKLRPNFYLPPRFANKRMNAPEKINRVSLLKRFDDWLRSL